MTTQHTAGSIQTISVETLRLWLDQGSVVVVDVRASDEFGNERILWPCRCTRVDAMELPGELIAVGVDLRSVLYLDQCTPISDRGYFAI